MEWRAWWEAMRREGAYAPLRPEPVLLRSARAPDEVLARIEAVTTPVRSPIRWYYGGDAVVRRGDARRLRLAVRRRPITWGRAGSDGGRPVADVRIDADPGGTVVSGRIAVARGLPVTIRLLVAVGVLMTGGGLVAGIVTRDPPALFPMAFGVVFAGSAVWTPWRSYGDRVTLRAVLEDAVS